MHVPRPADPPRPSPATPEYRRFATGCGLVPTGVGLLATVGYLLTASEFWFILGMLALVAAWVGVLAGALCLVAHACHGFPEAPGRRRLVPFLAAVLALLLPLPTAFACGTLVERLVFGATVHVTNVSTRPATIHLESSVHTDLSSHTVVLSPGDTTATTLSRLYRHGIELRVDSGPAIALTPPPDGTFFPLRGYHLTWDGESWARAR